MFQSPDRDKVVRVRIEGRVQGVGYRDWSQRTARELGLDGWVRNRRDASVEAAFAGPAKAVAEMLLRCKDGPPASSVTTVIVLEEGGELPVGFAVLPTT